jgi:hypothetical protein
MLNPNFIYPQSIFLDFHSETETTSWTICVAYISNTDHDFLKHAPKTQLAKFTVDNSVAIPTVDG